jgi:hypothetical protein
MFQHFLVLWLHLNLQYSPVGMTKHQLATFWLLLSIFILLDQRDAIDVLKVREMRGLGERLYIATRQLRGCTVWDSGQPPKSLSLIHDGDSATTLVQ